MNDKREKWRDLIIKKDEKQIQIFNERDREIVKLLFAKTKRK